jgi:hypothetical protein
MLKKKIMFFLFIFIIFFPSCQKYKNINLSKNNSFSTYTEKVSFINSKIKDSDKITSHNNFFSTNPQNIKQYLVYSSFIKGKITSKKYFLEKLNTTIKKFDGYIFSMEQINNETVNQTLGETIYIIIKIPFQNFSSFQDELILLFDSIDISRTNVEDITEEYIDVETRLKTKKEVRERFLNLLNKANNVSEILEIEKALKEINEEIEVVEGKYNFLKHRISYSTIEIEAYTDSLIINKPKFIIQVLKALKNGLNGFLSFILILLTLWPLYIISIIILFIIKLYKKNKKKKII